MERLTITLPLPPSKTTGNTRTFGLHRNRAVQTYKAVAVARYRETARPEWKRAKLDIRFHWLDNRVRDNLRQAHGVEAAIDGIVKAGLLPDDRWQCLDIGSITSTIDRANPRVELTFTKLE